MRNGIMLLGGLSLLVMLSSCAAGNRLVSVERTRILVDGRYDVAADNEAVAFLAPYKARVDSMMSPVVGRAAHDMAARRPESDLSNLLADVLLWGGGRFGEKPDFAVYNMGGIRAALSRGDVTFGDVLDVAPFENKICFLTLTGDKVMELFGQIAAAGGEGLSRGARLIITRDGRLVSAIVGGKPVKASGRYRVATLDYLAQGNDGFTAFKAGTEVVSPQSDENNVRYIIERYFRDAAERGEDVGSKVEGRIVVE